MSKSLIIIGFVWPEPNTTAAGNRMLQLISVFQKYDFRITFLSTASKSDKSFPLEKLNIQTYQIELNDAGFDHLIKSIKPNIVLFDRFLTEEQFGWRVAENCPQAIRILDTEDLHFLRFARHEAHKKGDKLNNSYLINELTKREIASIYRCDLSLIISGYEFDLLDKIFKIDTNILFYLPFLMDKLDKNVMNSYPKFNDRKNFMTIGNFKHEPNWNAVQYLKTEIWPLIRKQLPVVELHIYGAYATKKVMQLNNVKEGFIIKGWAENKEDVFTKAKVCLAPLRFGAGLKGKLVDAMKYGTPSITTTIGSEGLHDELQWNGFVTDKPEEFAENAVDLYKNKELWLVSQTNGLKIINLCFDKTKYANSFINTLQNMQKDIVKHRQKNFIGSMLLHHTLQSTKYLSKWIEEKNRKILVQPINKKNL